MISKNQLLPTNYIRRDDLIDKLIVNNQKPLIFVTAGAGYGKTTAILDYLETNQDKPVIWLTVYAHLNHPQVFYQKLLVEMGAVEKVELLECLQVSLMNHSLNPFIDILVQLLEKDSSQILVFDDIHLITNPLIKESLFYLFNHLPIKNQIILISRTLDWLPAAEFLLKNKLFILDQSDFYLDEVSSRALLAYEKRLSPKKEDEYVKLGSGWAAGLQLLSQLPETQNYNLGNSLMMLEQYLYNEIFVMYSEEVQLFLLVTSQLSTFSERIVQDLFPYKSFNEIMSFLHSKNMMVQQFNEKRITYGYHDLWLLFLRNEFEKKALTEKNNWRNKIMDSCLYQKEYDLAVQVALRSENYPKVMEIINEYGDEFYWDTYLFEVPDEVAISNLNFMYYKVIHLYTHFEMKKCRELIHLLEKTYPDSNEIEGLQSFLFLINESNNVFDCPYDIVVADIKQMTLNNFSKAILILTAAVFLYFRSKFREGIELLKEGNELITATKNRQLSFIYRLFTFQMYEGLGELSLAEEGLLSLEQDLTIANKDLDLFSYQIISQEISMIGVYLKQMNLEKAAEKLQIVEQRLVKQPRPALDFSIIFNKAEFLFLTGDIQKGNELTTQLLQINEQDLTGMIQSLSFLLRYSLFYDGLSRNQKRMIKEILEINRQADYHLDSELLLSLVYKEQGEKTKAYGLVNQVISFCRQEKIYLKLVEASLQKSYYLLKEASLSNEEFLDTYKEAIYYACDYEIKAFFYVFKEVVAKAEELKSKWLKDISSKEKSYHQKLVLLLNVSTTVKLTKREMEVLHLLSEGLTNKEISQTLFISGATTKTHVLKIYQKLEVNSRILAVQKARELKLIN